MRRGEKESFGIVDEERRGKRGGGRHAAFWYGPWWLVMRSGEHLTRRCDDGQGREQSEEVEGKLLR